MKATLCSRTLESFVWVETMATLFRRQHRMMAPCKDAPASSHERDSNERRIYWDAWLSMLGPSDRAAMLSVELLREEHPNE
jgi:hypothetical protein